MPASKTPSDIKKVSQVWWLTSTILTLGGLTEEGQESALESRVVANLSYMKPVSKIIYTYILYINKVYIHIYIKEEVPEKPYNF